MKEESNKYYQPQIEELLTEFINRGVVYTEMYGSDKLIQFDLSDDTIENNLRNFFDINNFDSERGFSTDASLYRLKYLDSQDIIDCGFEQLTEDCFNISGINYRGRLYCDLRILVRDTILIYIIDAEDNNYTLFTGIIKNKHELQTILKMIGVL